MFVIFGFHTAHGRLAGDKQEVLQAQVTMDDAMLFEMLQAIAELEEKEANTTFIQLRLGLVQNHRVPHEVSSGLARHLAGDDHHTVVLTGSAGGMEAISRHAFPHI